MKIIKPGTPPPPPEKLWWVGALVVCTNCSAIFELEANDQVSQLISTSTKLFNNWEVICPTCNTIVLFDHRNVNT